MPLAIVGCSHTSDSACFQRVSEYTPVLSSSCVQSRLGCLAQCHGRIDIQPPTQPNLGPGDRARELKIVGSKCVYKLKTDSDGQPERFKARIVAQTQQFGTDITEVFAPVISMTILRIFLDFWRLARFSHIIWTYSRRFSTFP